MNRARESAISSFYRTASSEEARARLAGMEELLRAVPVGLGLVDRDLRYRSVNERLASMSGCSPGDLVGRRPDEVTPALADQILPRFRKVLATGEGNPSTEVADPERDRSWIVSDHPVLGPDGSVTGIVTIVLDVSDLKRSERQVRAVGERLRRAEHFAGLGCWEWELPTGSIWWSQETFRILGQDPATFSPSFDAFLDQILPEDLPRVRDQLDRLWHGSEQASAEFRVTAPDGRERMLRGIATLRRAEDGSPRLLFGTVQDVTAHDEERRRWAGERAELERDLRRLEALLQERTGALDQALDRLRAVRRSPARARPGR